MFTPHRSTWCCVLVGALVAAAPSAAEDWPAFRGPRGDGTSAETLVPIKWNAKDNVTWKVKLPGHGSSSPIVWGERVLVTCFTGVKAKEIVRHVFCFERSKGDLLWTKAFPAPQLENDYESYLLQHGFASSTPTTDGERLYVFFGRDGVRAFDLDGKLLWHEQVGDAINGFGSGSSPRLFEDKLLVNATVELGAVAALERKSGKRLWKARLGDCWATPVIVHLAEGKREMVINGPDFLRAFDPDDGKELWSVKSVGGHISSTPLVKGDIVYVMNGGLAGKYVMAVRAGGRGDVTKTHVLWKQAKAGASHCSMLLLRDAPGKERLVYFSGNGMELNASDGEITRQERLDGVKNLYASPIQVADKIVLFTRDAGAYVMSAKDLSVVAHNDLGDASSFNASPALSEGQLFIRSNQFLYCIGPRVKGK